MSHDWDDGWEYWDDLNAAVDYFSKLIRKYRLPVTQVKEKYGTLRCYMSGLGFENLHYITHPGHCYSRYPKWLWRMCCGGCLSSRNWFWRWLVYRPSAWVHSKLYRRAYRKTVEKWPHLAAELLSMADARDLLVGIVDQDKCEHSSTWTSNKGRQCGVCMKWLEEG